MRTRTPTDQPGDHRPRRTTIWLVAIVVGLAAALASSTVTQEIRSTGTEDEAAMVTEQLPDRSVEVMGPVDPDTAITQTGAEIELGEGTGAVEGLPGGTWITELDVVEAVRRGELTLPESLREPTTTATSVPPEGTVPASSTTTEVPDGGGASTGEQIDLGAVAAELAQVDLAATPDLARFTDACAEGKGPCPPGEPGTVLPFAGTGGGADTLEIRLWPGLNGLTAKNLTCNSGYHTSTRLPLVVTADDPVGWISISLSIDGVAQLDSVYENVGDPEKKADWEARVNSGQAVGTDLDDSIHYCFSLRTEADPNNAATLSGTALPAGAQYTITANALALDGPNQATATTTYALTTTFQRPPTEIRPYSTHRAQVIVPQIGDAEGEVRVWAEGAYMDQKCSTFGASDFASAEYVHSYPSLAPRKYAVPSDPYPYDRAHSHFTVWNLLLRDSTDYVVCVQWRAADHSWGPSETWEVETPAALHFSLYVGTFSAKGSDVLYRYTVRPEGISGCYRWWINEKSNESNRGTDNVSCDSAGWPVPLATALTMERQDTNTGAYRTMGQRTFLTATVCDTASAGSADATPPLITLLAGCGPYSQDVTLYWMTANVLCGGPVESCGNEYVDATLQARVSVYQPSDWAQLRQGALNWGISLVGATYAPGLPSGGQPLP